jgi:Tfp pilus assembly protein PilX
MRNISRYKMHNKRHARKRDSTRGVALIVTLLLLMLLVAMTLAMTIAVTSDTLITRYYRNFRASFYAADSGVNIARQYMLNQLSTNALAVGTNFAATGAPPLSSTDGSTALSNTLTAYSSATSIPGGSGASSWPSKFHIVSSQAGTLGTTVGTATCTPVFTAPTTGTMNTGPYNCTTNLPTCTGTCTSFAVTSFQYSYPYTITAIGQSLANEQTIVEDAGNLILNVNIGTATAYQQSFAAWGTFINSYPECSSPFATGTLTGPFFTNGAWTFETGSYIFTGKVGSVSTTFGYDFGNNCYSSANPTYKSGSSTIAPTFQSGYTLGANSIPLPANDYSQKEAAVDGYGNQWTTATTAAQMDALMSADLKTYSGTVYPSTGTTNNGVYLPYTTATTASCSKPPCMTGGGIYVEGNANSVTLTAANPTVSGTVHNQQVFTITQGTSTITTTTVTIDMTANTTTISSQVGNGTVTTNTIAGVPENYSGATTQPATMLYVDGTIGNSNNTGLSGPGQGEAAIENGAQVTVTAKGNIDVTGDLLYQEEPVTTTQNQSVSSSLTTTACCSGDPTDTLIPYKTPPTGVLGLFTATGDIAEYNQQSNGNIEIDAALAMISTGGSGGWVNDGNAINTITVVGGRVANQAKACNCNTRNLYFDQRFAQGLAPPWYPSTTVTPTSSDSVTSVVPTVQRTQWLDVY